MFFLLSLPVWSSSLSFTEAKELATSSNKNIFVNYTADWCLPCQIFEVQVLSERKVNQMIGSEFVVITADYDDVESMELYDDFASACMLTMYILDEERTILTEMLGTMIASQFYEEIYQYAKIDIIKDEEIQADTRLIPVASSIPRKAVLFITEYNTLQSGAFSSWDNAILIMRYL